MKMNKELLIFDLDDTIYPEYTYNLACYKAASEQLKQDYGVDSYTIIENLFSQRIYTGLFEKVSEYFNLNLTEYYIFNSLVKTYRGHIPTLKPYHGFIKNIDLLREKYSLSIITDGNKEIQRKKIKSLGIEPYFDYIVCSSELGKGVSKPMPLPYDTVLNYFDIPPEKSVYIGDNLAKDFIYPKSIGMHSIHLMNIEENNNLIYQNKKGTSADYTYYSYSELIQNLPKVFKEK